MDKIEQMLAKLIDGQEQILTRLDKLEVRLGKLEERVGKLEERVGKLEERVGKLEERVGKLEERVGSLEVRVDSLESDMRFMKDKMVSLENGVTENTRITLAIRNALETSTAQMDALTIEKVGRTQLHDVVGLFADAANKAMEMTEKSA